jgi:hypothetical protein
MQLPITEKLSRLYGGVSHILQCENERCNWYRTRWTVAVDKNGSIPIRAKGPKEHPQMTPDQLAMGRRFAEEAARDDPAMARRLRELEGE